MNNTKIKSAKIAIKALLTSNVSYFDFTHESTTPAHVLAEKLGCTSSYVDICSQMQCDLDTALSLLDSTRYMSTIVCKSEIICRFLDYIKKLENNLKIIVDTTEPIN